MKKLFFSILITISIQTSYAQTIVFDWDNFALFWGETISYDDMLGFTTYSLGLNTFESLTFTFIPQDALGGVVPGIGSLTASGQSYTIATNGGSIHQYYVSIALRYVGWSDGLSHVIYPDPLGSVIIPLDNLSSSNIGSVCSNSGSIDLNNFVNLSGCTFSGPGVSGTTFIPSNVSAGLKTLTAYFSSQSSTFTVTVLAQPTGTFPDQSICNNSTINLTTVSTHTGTATYSGPGVSGTTFTPVTAGVGDHTLTMNLSLSGCTNSYTASYSVNDIKPASITFEDLGSMCNDASSIDLTTKVSYAGGTFSGTGVSGSTFTPKNTTPGDFQLTYTVGNTGCEVSLLSDVTINSVPTLYATDINDVCLSTPIDLKALDPAYNETFTGTSVVNGVFNPSVAREGNFTINSSFTTAQGCLATSSFNIEVTDFYDPNVTFNFIPDQCTTNDRLLLSDYINNYDAYGTFSGTGVSLGYFYPDDAGAGTYNLIYKRGSGVCYNEQSVLVDVISSTPVTFSNVPIQCKATLLNLTNYVSLQGGTFSGTGVSGDYFNVETAGIGDHVINYSYTNGNGCTSITPKTITVQDLLPDVSFNAIPEQCTSNPRILLSGYVDNYSTLGTFSGTGVSLGYFYPETSGDGTFQISYKIGSGVCLTTETTMVDVYASTPATFSTIPVQCRANSIDLRNYISPLGGTFSGTGVSDNYFDIETAGIGDHIINYSYTNANGCTSVTPYTIKVQDLLPDVSFNAIPDQCTSNSRILLSDYVNNYSNLGTFSGTGVSLGYFYPQTAGDGTFQISYKIGSGTCLTTETTMVDVYPTTSVSFSTIPIQCESNSINLASFVNIQGGTFSGTGVTGNYFDVQTAGIGSHVINYSYTNTNGCTSINPYTIKIDDILPSVNFSLPDNICSNSPRMYLFDYVDYDYGSFTGDGVDLNYLEPENLSDGLHSATFNYGNGSCRTSTSETFTIILGDAISLLDIPDICNGDSLYLPDYVSPKNGEFSGTGISGYYFNSNLSSFGNHTFYYTVTSGCTSTTPLNIFVRPSINANFYANDSSILVTKYVKFIPFLDNSLYQYYWTFGDNTFSNEIKPIHYYYHSGNQTVSLTIQDADNICSNQVIKTDFISVDGSTSFEELSKKEYFKIRPFGRIEFKAPGNYKITDLNGKVLIADKNQIETIQIPLHEGIYILSFQTGNQYLTKKFFID